MTVHDGGKGDTLIQPLDKEQFDKNWDTIFNKKPETNITFEIGADNDHAEILTTITFNQ